MSPEGRERFAISMRACFGTKVKIPPEGSPERDEFVSGIRREVARMGREVGPLFVNRVLRAMERLDG